MSEDRKSDQSEKPVVWLINHYGGRQGKVRSERTWRVAEGLAKGGFRCILISASHHHIRSEEIAADEIETLVSEQDGYEFFAVSTRAYVGNGLDRMRNMHDFYRGLKRLFLGTALPKPDLVIASSPHPFTFLFANWAKKKTGVAVVLEERDIWPRSLVELTGTPAWHPVVLLFDWMARRGYRGCDALVSLLPNSEAFLRERGLRGEFFCIPNGVGESEKENEKETVPKDVEAWFESAGAAEKMTLVYAGAMGPPNALEQLVELASVTDEEEKPYRILCFGDGVSRAELTATAKEKASDFLTVRGPVSRSVAKEIIERTDLCFISLRPSPIFELGVSPNKLFEYMAAGKPVVFSVNSSNNPVAESGGGVSVTPYAAKELDAALRRLAAMSEPERAELGEKGKAYVKEHHHWDQLGKEYASVVGTVIANRGEKMKS
ncbi:glycosyltransferase family 4 protein [bacterium]|nr:glycosyltransferase family 4 protein [bacterium]